MHSFRLDREFIELDKLLKLLGIAASGGQAKHMIANGHVLVDGTIELRKTRKVYAGSRVRCGVDDIEVLPPP
jgi:ribosome-associated protein